MKREEIDWESEKEKKQRDKKAFLKATLRNTQSESPAFFADAAVAVGAAAAAAK